LQSGALKELSPIDSDYTGEFADVALNIRAANYLCKMGMETPIPTVFATINLQMI